MRKRQDKCTWRALPGERLPDQHVCTRTVAERIPMSEPTNQDHDSWAEEANLVIQVGGPSPDLRAGRRSIRR